MTYEVQVLREHLPPRSTRVNTEYGPYHRTVVRPSIEDINVRRVAVVSRVGHDHTDIRQ